MSFLKAIDTDNDDVFSEIEDLSLDDVLKNDENRQQNNFGLYRINALLVGGTGSGKTTYLIKALLSDYISHYQHIFLFLPPESIASGLWKRVIELYPQRFTPITIEPKEGSFSPSSLIPVEELNQISEALKGEIAIVLDDFINAFNKNDWIMLKRYITQLSRVKYGASLFCLVQDVHTLPVAYRKNFNVFIVFPCSLTYLQFSDILSNYFNAIVMTQDQKKELYELLKPMKHTSLTLINNNDAMNCLKIGFKPVMMA